MQKYWYLLCIFKVVKENERDAGPGKDHRRENAPERDRLDERGRGHLEDRDVSFLVTRFSFPNFRWTGMFIVPDDCLYLTLIVGTYYCEPCQHVCV